MVSPAPMSVNRTMSAHAFQPSAAPARIGRMWRASVLLVALLLTVFAATCDSSDGLQRIEGQVEEALGPPFGLPEYLRVIDEGGRQWDFTIEPTVTFSTSHLLQHKARYEKVVVYYRETEEGLSAVRLTD